MGRQDGTGRRDGMGWDGGTGRDSGTGRDGDRKLAFSFDFMCSGWDVPAGRQNAGAGGGVGVEAPVGAGVEA